MALQDLPLAEILQRIGRVPLPHYIRGGNMVDSDVADYQTVYAKHAGSIAAPTAGLHFTSPLLRRIIDRGVRIAAVTLHVGLGTFRPLECDDIDQHTMHAEHGVISESAAEIINETRSAGGRVIAVGTTTARILESATRQNRILPWNGSTDLFIKPGFQFQIVDGLITNFHLPRTTLLVLVRTFGGDDLIRRAYEEAVREKYRFFSYGDAMLIL
jgi:S-adenosylmethionine:tRNA ribosyltransferase-isomerase